MIITNNVTLHLRIQRFGSLTFYILTVFKKDEFNPNNNNFKYSNFVNPSLINKYCEIGELDTYLSRKQIIFEEDILN